MKINSAWSIVGGQAAQFLKIRENMVFGNDVGVEIVAGNVLVEGNTIRNN